MSLKSVSKIVNIKRHKVFIALPIPFQEATKLFDKHNVDLTMNHELPLSREKLLKESKGCHGILCFPMHKIDKELLDYAGPQLKVKLIIKSIVIQFNHFTIK